MTYLAALFPRLRVGSLVLGQSYRNPALLAKMAATLQELTRRPAHPGPGRRLARRGIPRLQRRLPAAGHPRATARRDDRDRAGACGRSRRRPSSASTTASRAPTASRGPTRRSPSSSAPTGRRPSRVAARLADIWCWDGPWDDNYRAPHDILRAACEAIGRPFDEIALHAELTIELPDDPSTFVPTYEHPFYPGQTFRIVGPSANRRRARDRDPRRPPRDAYRHQRRLLVDAPPLSRRGGSRRPADAGLTRRRAAEGGDVDPAWVGWTGRRRRRHEPQRHPDRVGQRPGGSPSTTRSCSASRAGTTAATSAGSSGRAGSPSGRTARCTAPTPRRVG